MEWIDTHSHLYDGTFQEDMDQVIQDCKDAGLSRIYLPNVDLESIDALHALSEKDPGLFFPMMGLHPTSVKADWKTVLAEIKEQLYARPEYYVAVGEIGTDLYWDKTFECEMEICFREQAAWAADLNKPIIIHSRDSLDWNIGMVAELKTEYPNLTGIFHCFNGTEEQALRIQKLGFLIGIGGVITFKNAGVAEALTNVPLDIMVMETDAPYLAPVPYRGKRNHSMYIPLIAQKLAEVKDCSLDEIARITTKNALTLFGT